MDEAKPDLAAFFGACYKAPAECVSDDKASGYTADRVGLKLSPATAERRKQLVVNREKKRLDAPIKTRVCSVKENVGE